MPKICLVPLLETVAALFVSPPCGARRLLKCVPFVVFVAVLFGPALGFSQRVAKTDQAAFLDYVQRPDAAYAWRVVDQIEGNPTDTFVVRLTSQSWRTADEVDRTTWKHWLVVTRPEKVRHETAFLLLGGGSNGSNPPRGPDGRARKIAEMTGSVVAELKMVPNQPLIFHDDGQRRWEDDLIGYAWKEYLDSGDPTWLPRFAMVKSAVRAMDSIQELMASREGGELKIDKFVVAGASKRGWTTWLTGAADPRVQAIVPIVIDVLNMDASMRHHAEVYGFWADAIGNYVQHGITQRWDDPRMKSLYALVDPFSYRDRLDMPKFIVNACGDQFFCLDSSQFYLDKLTGEKLLRYVPNADHSLGGSDAFESILAFYQRVLADKPRPRFDWTFEPDGSIRVATTDRPAAVVLWHATNPVARDFRVKTIGAAFNSQPLVDNGEGVYVGRVPLPEQGWMALLVELTYRTGDQLPLKLTTAVRILPETLPHEGVDPNKVPYERDKE